MASEHDPLAILGLDQEQLERRLTSVEACAMYYRTAYGPHLYGATMTVLAASCWTLIDAPASQQWWFSAMEHYAELRHPYADLIAVCAGMTGLDQMEIQLPPTALALQCRILLLAWLSVVTPEDAPYYCEQLEHSAYPDSHVATMCPGQLNLPLYRLHYFARVLCDDLRQEKLSTHTVNTAGYLLRRAADTVRAAQADQYHWRRVLPGFMPVEPEWLAVGRIIYEAATRANIDCDDVAHYLDPLERIPLVLAGRMPPPVGAGRKGSGPRSPTAGGESTSHRKDSPSHNRDLGGLDPLDGYPS
jgi:hypothetical protein